MFNLKGKREKRDFKQIQEGLQRTLDEALYMKRDFILRRNFLMRNPKLVKDLNEALAGTDEIIIKCNNIVDRAKDGLTQIPMM